MAQAFGGASRSLGGMCSWYRAMSTSQTQAPTLGNATRHRVDSVHELVDRRNVGKIRFSYEKEKKRESNQELWLRLREWCVCTGKKKTCWRKECMLILYLRVGNAWGYEYALR